MGVIWFAAKPFGRQAAGAVAVVAVIGALSFFSVRTMVLAAYERGDVPKDLLIYTQSSPDIPKIATRDRPARRRHRQGLRPAHRRRLGRLVLLAVGLVPARLQGRRLRQLRQRHPERRLRGPARELLEQREGARDRWRRPATPVTPRRPNTRTAGGSTSATSRPCASNARSGDCTAQTGNCGPFRPGDLGAHLRGHHFSEGWLATWAKYWRDHDPDEIFPRVTDRSCQSCGSVERLRLPPGELRPGDRHDLGEAARAGGAVYRRRRAARVRRVRFAPGPVLLARRHGNRTRRATST